MIRETLLQQIKEKARKNLEEREKDVLYGQKLSVLAGMAQKQELERVKMQKQMQFGLLVQDWDEMKKSKEELRKIDKLFK